MRHNSQWVIRAISLATALASCLSGHGAQWGSIRGNNRSPGEFRQKRPEVARGREHEHEHEGMVRAAPRIENRHWSEEARERHRLDIDEDRRRGYFWSGINAGMVFNALPSGYVPVYVSGTPYYYYQGAYYEQAPTGYVAVNPPIGAVVPVLPPGAEALGVGQQVYYYAGGAFYLQQPQGFAVVAPPLGITVESLPPGAVPVYMRGVLYYQSAGAYFLPEMEGGVTVYTTVQPS